MNERPTSVTVISWILIVLNGISMVSVLTMINNPVARDLIAKNPIPVPIQYAMTFLGLVIVLTCGIFMLRAANWARLLYMGWSALGLVIGVFTSPVKLMLIPGVVIYGIFVFFLTRPRALAYFQASPHGPTE